MAISDKTRKLLWGQAGGRCSFCQHSLVTGATGSDDESIMGDECHIFARNEGGSRYNSTISENELDSYENLILLCKNHHKMIDDQPTTFTPEYLVSLKANHELWVHSKLQTKNDMPKTNFALRVDKASDVVRITGDCEAYDFQHDELETEVDSEAVATFLQDLLDYGDIHSEMGIADRTRFTFDIKDQMKELSRMGFAIFMSTRVQTFGTTGNSIDFSVAMLKVVRMTNPSIQTINLSDL